MTENAIKRKNGTISTLNLIKLLDLVEINHMNLEKLILYFFDFYIKSYSLFNSEKQQVLVTSIFPLIFSFLFYFIFFFSFGSNLHTNIIEC
jgi:hypothetical protein